MPYLKRFPDTPLPEWLAGAAREIRQSPEGRALMIQQFEMVFPRVIELVSTGYTLGKALKELPIDIDSGAFLGWLRKQPKMYEIYREAKEIRTEAWAGEIIKHALGEETMNDVARSRLIVDTYKWLMSADNRKNYGESKAIEVTTNISISAALEQAQGRIIDVSSNDIDLIEESEYKQLSSGEDSYED